MLHHSFLGVDTDGTSAAEFQLDISVDNIKYMSIESARIVEEDIDDEASREEVRREYWPFLE